MPAHTSSSSGSIHYTRSASVVGVELMLLRNCAKSWKVHHDRYAIPTMYKGGVDSVRRGRPLEATPGTFSVVEPGDYFANPRIHAPSNAGVLFVDPHVMVELSTGRLNPSSWYFSPEAFEAGALVSALHRTAVRAVAEHEDRLIQESALSALLTGLIERAGDKRARKLLDGPACGTRTLRRLRERLEPVPHEPSPSLNTIATELGCESFQLCRQLQRELGLTPHQYRIQRKIDRARALLVRGVPLATVAHEAGFCDQAHLSRQFKRIVGVTPGVYAKATAP